MWRPPWDDVARRLGPGPKPLGFATTVENQAMCLVRFLTSGLQPWPTPAHVGLVLKSRLRQQTWLLGLGLTSATARFSISYPMKLGLVSAAHIQLQACSLLHTPACNQLSQTHTLLGLVPWAYPKPNTPAFTAGLPNLDPWLATMIFGPALCSQPMPKPFWAMFFEPNANFWHSK